MNKRVAAIACATALLTLIGATAPAHADSPGDTAPVIAGMNVVGYDESVADANGFEIVTYPDGSWASVAVTPPAQEIQEAYGGPQLVDPNAPVASRVSVSGNCGSSWIEVLNSGSVKRVNTGYNVPVPVANRITWKVQVSSLGGFPVLSWPSGPSGAAWWGTSTFSTGGIGGFAWVTNSSSVLLIDGRICSSGSPTEGY